MVQDDRAGRHARRQPESPAQDQRPGDLEVAEVSGAGRHRKAQEQRRVGGHRLQRRHGDADRGEKEREIERVDHQRQHREGAEASRQLRCPQPAGAGAKRKSLAGQARRQPRREHPAGQTRARDSRPGQRRPQHRRQQRDGERRGACEPARRIGRASQRDDLQGSQHEGHRGKVACLVDHDRGQR